MKNQYSRKELNHLISDLLRGYTESIHQQEAQPPSPHFMTRVQARIQAKQTPVNYFWETGIIKAQKWLVAFSLIAILFFVSNLVFAFNAPRGTADPTSDAFTLTDHDWDHLNDEPIQVSETTMRH